jgi:hypothetical protein
MFENRPGNYSPVFLFPADKKAHRTDVLNDRIQAKRADYPLGWALCFLKHDDRGPYSPHVAVMLSPLQYASSSPLQPGSH